MKRKYQVQVAASLTKWYDIEADNEREARGVRRLKTCLNISRRQTP